MPTFDFTSPEGASYSVQGPDGATPAQAFQILQQHLGGVSPVAPASDANTFGDIAKSAGIGLAKGAIGLAGLPGDLTDLASRGYDYATGSNTNATVAPYGNAIGSQNIQKKIENYTGQFYQPKTTAGQYAQTVGEFAPAVLGGPEGLATRALTRAVVPGVASEAAGQATQGTALEPVARIAGAIAGAGLPRAVSRAASPATIGADRAAAIQGLADNGVTDMTAGMRTGNKAIQYAQSENATAADAAANINTLKQLTGSVMKRAGVPDELNTGQAVPEVLAANRENLSNQFGTLLAPHPAIPITDFNSQAQRIVNEFKAGTNASEAPALQYFIDKVNQGATPTETISKAALKTPAGQIFTGLNHGEAFASAAANGKAGNVTDGFITSTGRFVDRREANNVVGANKSENMQSLNPMGKSSLSDWPKEYQNIVRQLRAQNIPDETIAKSLGISAPKSTNIADAISGIAYQNIQSELGKALKSSYGTPGLTHALGELKDALDSSVANGLKASGNSQAFQALQQLRGQWRDQNILEKAITNSGQYGAEHGVVTPSALFSAVNSTSAKRNAVALGSTPLAGLARDAKAVIGNITPPQSGTAPRLAAKVVPALMAGAVGSLIGGPHVGLGAGAAMLAPMIASHTYGKMLMAGPVQRYLANQAALPLRQGAIGPAALRGAVLALPGARDR